MAAWNAPHARNEDGHSKASPSSRCPCFYRSDDQLELRQIEKRGVSTIENRLHLRAICFYLRQQQSLHLVLGQKAPSTDESGPEVKRLSFGKRQPITLHPATTGFSH